MRKERFNNSVTMSLTSTINTTNTAIDITGASGLPSNGDFRLVIENEILKATARSGNIVTVTRGVDSTSAATHSSSVNVAVILTACSMQQAISDAVGPLAYPSDKGLVVPKVASDFTLTNGGTYSTLTDDTWGGITLMPEPHATVHYLRSALITAPSTPWTLRIMLQGPGTSKPSNTGGHSGLIVYDTISGRAETLGFRAEDTVSWWEWSSLTSYGGLRKDIDFQYRPEGVWFDLEDDGTNLTSYVSYDGLEWFYLGAFGRTSYMTNGANRLGFYATSFDYDFRTFYHLKHWSLT